ncbi:MAG TPA: transcriptional repressor [Phycisphaerales bacterium]|nr:transcriptional repressor [Phycisphaerales bacterium]HMP38288.1 transcriptional repressor [Phycisphaerales bacterium]
MRDRSTNASGPPAGARAEGAAPPPASLGRSTRQRRLIVALLERARRPLSPAELVAAAREQLPTIGVSTIYRTIRALEEAGEIVAVEIPGRASRYEPSAAASRHHHHFHCRSCDRLYDVRGCPGDMEELLPHGFALEEHTILLSGRCEACNQP